jgi:hypothetical protein
LEVRQVHRPLAQPELTHASPNGAGADQDNAAPRLTNALDLIGQCCDPMGIQYPLRRGYDIRAHFDNQRAGQGHDFLADGIDHRAFLPSGNHLL